MDVLFVVLAFGVVIVILYFVPWWYRRGKGSEVQDGMQVNVSPPSSGMDRSRLAGLRATLSLGCPNCHAQTGITAITDLDQVASAARKKCFYCGFDFASLSAESEESDAGQS